MLKNQFFRIYFILEKFWKNVKDLRFFEFQNYFLKEKSMDYVHGAGHWVHDAGSRSTVPSLNTSHSIVDGRLRLEQRRGTREIESDP